MAVIEKYLNLSSNTISEIESFIETIEADDVKEHLYQDFNEALKVMRIVNDKSFSKEVVSMYFWIKYETDLDITLEQASYYYNNVKDEGYMIIDDDHVMCKRDSNLRRMVKEVLENAMQYDTCVSRLLEKDEIIEYWLNGTSVKEAIDELVDNTDARELLDLEQLSMFTDDDGEEYMYSSTDL